jgi:uncharacterized membrane protein (DUF106 family)
VTFITDILNRLFDLLVTPFGKSAVWAMIFLSLVTGILMLLLFKWSTNQDRLASVKRRLLGHLYELGLYQENLRVMFRIQGDLAKANLRYLATTLPALLAILLPLLLILAQLDSRFAHRPFTSGETSLVTATVDAAHEPLLDKLELVTSPEVVVESLPVRDHRRLTATWRVRVAADGRHDLILAAPDGDRWTKQLVAGTSGLPRLATVREQASWRRFLFNPAESPLPGDSKVTRIALQLPTRQTRYLGIGLHWLVAFCIFSLVFGFAMKDVFKVKI